MERDGYSIGRAGFLLDVDLLEALSQLIQLFIFQKLLDREVIGSGIASLAREASLSEKGFESLDI
jgi:hypothetical protein